MKQYIANIKGFRALFTGVAIVGYLLLSFACSTSLQTPRGTVLAQDTIAKESPRGVVDSVDSAVDSVDDAVDTTNSVGAESLAPIVIDTTAQSMGFVAFDSIATDSVVIDSIASDGIATDSIATDSVDTARSVKGAKLVPVNDITSNDLKLAPLSAVSAPVTAAVAKKPLDKPLPKPVADTPEKKPRQGSSDKDDGPMLVDYRADMQVNYGDNITRMIGNVKFHHNGAIIECDSAYMYSDDRMEFFSRVIIEKDSAYVYGDRVLYDGNTNLADVYAPIVKTVQGDATMYSYNLQFNTKTSVGVFSGGGVMSQKDNVMEARRGYFDANADYVKFLDSVAMRNGKYIIKTDSLGFDFGVERADFLTRTFIWDSERDFLMADGGHYFSPTSTYLFTSNAYVMTPDNELWADTMRYLTDVKQAYMFDNVQILDTANATVSFGDWAFYDDSIGRAVLTLTPSVRLWEDADTSYMRGDTIMLLTFEPGMSKADLWGDGFDIDDALDSELNSSAVTAGDTTVLSDSMLIVLADSLAVVSRADSLVMLSDTLSPPLVSDTTLQDIGVGEPPVSGDSVGRLDSVPIDSMVANRIDTTATATGGEGGEVVSVVEPEEDVVKKKKKTKKNRRKPRVKRSKRKQKIELSDRTIEADSTVLADSISVRDSLSGSLADSTLLAIDSSAMDSSLVGAGGLMVFDSMAVDSVDKELVEERVVRAYHGVRIWSEEYQAKCDSTVSFSVDSTTVMYGKPVLWSKSNQINSEMIELFTKNGDLDWADFTGDPFVAQQVLQGDTSKFNQARGKRMEAYFTKNELDYIFMSGNVENIYYMDEEGEVAALAVIECADLTMYFEGREPTRMIWSGSGSGPIYPIEKVPEEQSRFLSGFLWQDSIRPKSAFEICKRSYRPSIREEVTLYSQPLFVISILMDQAKERGLKDGSWSDRTDIPTLTPQYFIEAQREFLY